MPGSRLTSTTGPSNPSSRRVAAAVPPVLPPPTITIGLARPRAGSLRHGLHPAAHRDIVRYRTATHQPIRPRWAGQSAWVVLRAVRVGYPLVSRRGVNAPGSRRPVSQERDLGLTE